MQCILKEKNLTGAVSRIDVVRFVLVLNLSMSNRTCYTAPKILQQQNPNRPNYFASSGPQNFYFEELMFDININSRN